jgi:Protein of unknown function (DUF3592)
MTQANRSKSASQPKLRSRLLGLGFIVVALLVAGLSIGWYAYVQLWPVTEAVVIESMDSLDSDGNDSGSVVYEYTVNGQKYTGSERESGYAKGSTLIISYNPSLPQLSTRGNDNSAPFVFLIISLCCFIPLGLLIIGTTLLPDQSIAKIYNIPE